MLWGWPPLTEMEAVEVPALIRRAGSKQTPKVFHAGTPEDGPLCNFGAPGNPVYTRADTDAWPSTWWNYCERCFDTLCRLHAVVRTIERRESN